MRACRCGADNDVAALMMMWLVLGSVSLFFAAAASAAATAPTTVTKQQQQELGPCDIYAAGATPCVAAHSTVRALLCAYSGPLYQVRKRTPELFLLQRFVYICVWALQQH